MSSLCLHGTAHYDFARAVAGGRSEHDTRGLDLYETCVYGVVAAATRHLLRLVDEVRLSIATGQDDRKSRCRFAVRSSYGDFGKITADA
jgi:hypothetical protein